MPATAWIRATTSLPSSSTLLASARTITSYGPVTSSAWVTPGISAICARHRGGLADLGLDQDVGLDHGEPFVGRMRGGGKSTPVAPGTISPRGLSHHCRRGRGVRPDRAADREVRRRYGPRAGARPGRRRGGAGGAGRPGGGDDRPAGRRAALPPGLVDRHRRRPQGRRAEPGRRRRDGRGADRPAARARGAGGPAGGLAGGAGRRDAGRVRAARRPGARRRRGPGGRAGAGRDRVRRPAGPARR